MSKPNSTYCVKNRGSAIRESLAQIVAVSIKNILLLSFGMTLGFPTILIAGLRNLDENLRMSEEELSWIGSIILITIPFGCLLSGPLSQKLGRKKMMQISTMPLIACWLFFRFSNSAWHIYFSLCLVGLVYGLIEAPVITYAAEVTTPNLRGILASMGTLATIAGVLIEFLLGTFFHWRNVALYSAVAPIVAFNLLILVPESPHYLLAKKRFDEARMSLAWLRGWVDPRNVKSECEEMNKSLNVSVERSLASGTFWKPMALVVFVFFLQHFTGMTNVQTYSVEIFTALDTPIDKYYATVILGCFQLLGCMTCVLCVHFMGKRMLIFTCMLLSCACLMGVATYAYLNDLTHLREAQNLSNATTLDDLKNVSWVPTVCLMGFAYFSHAGLRVLPWVLTGEVYAHDIRALASGISAACGCFFGFIVNKIFFLMVADLTLPGLFYFYATLNAVGVGVLYFTLPETEGKSLEEISSLFAPKQANDMKCGSELYGLSLNVVNANATDGGNTYTKCSSIDGSVF